jgi:hypothetical protein
MDTQPAHLILTLKTRDPIEVKDFITAFTAVAGQYEDFVKEHYPDLKSESATYVREVRAGSIQADLIPVLSSAFTTGILIMDQALIVEQFIRSYGEKLRVYLRGGRIEPTDKSDLKDFMGQVAAIANDPDGTGTIDHAYFEDGVKKIKAGIKFNTPEARTAVRQIEKQRRDMERETTADYQRVLMVFSQSNTKDIDLHKRSGDRVVIEEISPSDRPLIYASDLAEQRIKHEIREADENVFKKGFIVDVNVQSQGGRPVGYRVTNVHQVIDLAD